MIELLKLALERPLHAVIVALAIAVSINVTGVVSVKQAVAVLQNETKDNQKLETLVNEMNLTLTRVDAKVDNIKETIDREQP